MPTNINFDKKLGISLKGTSIVLPSDETPFENLYSLLFDDVDTMVTMGDVLDMADDGTDSYSVSVWFKTTSTQSYQQLIGKQVNGGKANGWNLSIIAAASHSKFRGFLVTAAGSN